MLQLRSHLYKFSFGPQEHEGNPDNLGNKIYISDPNWYIEGILHIRELRRNKEP